MKRVVKKLEKSKVEVLCDVDAKVWKDAQEKAFHKLANELTLPGFRKGKAPEDMARKHIDNGKVMNEAINEVLQPAFDEVLKEEKLQPFARPSVDVTKVSDSELQLKFTIILQPDVVLGEYKNLGIAKDKVVVNEKEIDAEIDKLVAQNASLVASDKPAKVGDTVVMDFVGYVDGKEFDGGKAENYSLELGSHQFVPGFEEQLVGVKNGDSVEVNVTFPEQYVAELAGKKAMFKVTVHEVKSKVVPELNADLIKELAIPEVKDVEGLRKYEATQLKSSKENQAVGKLLDSIIDKIVASSKIELADEIIAEEVEGMKHNMEQQMSQRGLTIEQYLQITGQSQADLEKHMKDDAEKNLRAVLVMSKIAELENIKVEEKDLEEEFAKISAQYNMPVDKVKEILGKDMNRFASEIRQRRIQDFLISANEKKEAVKAEAKPAAKKAAK